MNSEFYSFNFDVSSVKTDNFKRHSFALQISRVITFLLIKNGFIQVITLET